ncbi:MAG TPA: hypothetical protein VF241_11330 [Propionibacteriaceae bacterium]
MSNQSKNINTLISELGAIVGEVLAPVRFRRKAIAVASAFVVVSAAAACSSGAAAPQTAPSAPESPAPSPVAATASTPSPSASAKPSSSPVTKNANYKKFDPKNFVDPLGGENRWYPLVPGTQTLRTGSINRGSRKLTHKLRVTVTDVTKVVNGVTTVAVLDQDIDAGQVGEASLDYLAQDKYGNVWYMGSYTEIYEGGQFVNAVDAWLTPKQGSKPGVWMMADPQDGMKYVEAHNSRETIRAEVTKVDDRKCVPFKCFKALQVLEDGHEFKYFGPGVGHIATEPNYSGGEQEKEALINVVKLTSKGLAEMSGEALRLDKHARKESKIFAKSEAAKRS